MLSNPDQTLGNRLLAALPPEPYERLVPHLEPVSFSLGEVVYESGGHMRHVYFPTTSHISLLYTMIDGSTAEMGLVGNEGVVGISFIHGWRDHAEPRHGAGCGGALRMKAKAMLDNSNVAANSSTCCCAIRKR